MLPVPLYGIWSWKNLAVLDSYSGSVLKNFEWLRQIQNTSNFDTLWKTAKKVKVVHQYSVRLLDWADLFLGT